MDLYELNGLKKIKGTDLYDFTKSVFVFNGTVQVFPHIVDATEAMRMDLISNNIYQTTDHVGFLCRINNIINPLNIKEGTVLIYCLESQIKSFRPDDDDLTVEVKQVLLNMNKAKRTDKKRDKFLKSDEENVPIPPTFNNKDTRNVNLGDDGVITIGTGEL